MPKTSISPKLLCFQCGRPRSVGSGALCRHCYADNAQKRRDEIASEEPLFELRSRIRQTQIEKNIYLNRERDLPKLIALLKQTLTTTKEDVRKSLRVLKNLYREYGTMMAAKLKAEEQTLRVQGYKYDALHVATSLDAERGDGEDFTLYAVVPDTHATDPHEALEMAENLQRLVDRLVTEKEMKREDAIALVQAYL